MVFYSMNHNYELLTFFNWDLYNIHTDDIMLYSYLNDRTYFCYYFNTIYGGRDMFVNDDIKF
jgi:hypothetical protein